MSRIDAITSDIEFSDEEDGKKDVWFRDEFQYMFAFFKYK